MLQANKAAYTRYRLFQKERSIELSMVSPEFTARVNSQHVPCEKLIIGRGLSAIRHKKELQSFLLYQLKHIFREEDSMGSGTIYKAITKDDLLNIKIIQPSREFDNNFNELVSPMDAEIENLTLRIENLRKTRDILLPKLISGEIDVEKLISKNS